MLIRIRDPESFGPWIRDGKIQIWDKHPGSATLLTVNNGFYLREDIPGTGIRTEKRKAQHATKSYMGSGADRFRIFF
jgi:hypothetical protein